MSRYDAKDLNASSFQVTMDAWLESDPAMAGLLQAKLSGRKSVWSVPSSPKTGG